MKQLTRQLLRRMPLPEPSDDDDKEQRGSLLAVGGSVETPGAILLAGVAGLRCGAGKLQLATDRSVAVALGLAVPEALVVALSMRGSTIGIGKRLRPLATNADALLVGPGMPEVKSVVTLARALAKMMKPDATLILDAAALAAAGTRERAVITPHAGEMATLLGLDRATVEDNAADVARTAAERFGCVVTLKGPTTFIATPDEMYEYSGGVVGLATSGSGDTLAGIVAGFAARGADPITAALWGVWAHGTAGLRLAKRVGRVAFLARELLDALPLVIRS
jgi:hydroxyethylthiazole kinase-like uncharacterized protein yjeF